MAVKKRSARERTAFVAQQLTFANTLGGNDKKLRYKALKKLSRFLAARSCGEFVFSEDDVMRIWQGLFYCYWMSDKPLVQEELCENISKLVHCFETADICMLFIKGFFSTMMQEWFGIDVHRMDKFRMFVRRFLRQSFIFCKNRGWDIDLVQSLAKVFRSTILATSSTVIRDTGLIMHFADIYLEELAKVGEETVPEETVLELLRPFAQSMMEQDDHRVRSSIIQEIFMNLIRQSPQGIEYEAKYQAWTRAGCPGDGPEDMVFVQDDDGDNNDKSDNSDSDTEGGSGNKILDPRAGRVNAVLPQIPFNPKAFACMFGECYKGTTRPKFKRCMLFLKRRFHLMGKGVFPLARKKCITAKDIRKIGLHKEDYDQAINEALERHFEVQKKKKKRKRGAEIEESEDDIPKEKKKKKVSVEVSDGKQIKAEKKKKKKETKESKSIENKEKYMMRKKERLEKKKLKMKKEEKEDKMSDEENMGANVKIKLKGNVEGKEVSSNDQVTECSNNFVVPAFEHEDALPSSSSITLVENSEVSTRVLRKKQKKESTPLDNKESTTDDEVRNVEMTPTRTLRVRTPKAKMLSTPNQTSWEVNKVNAEEDKSEISGIGDETLSKATKDKIDPKKLALNVLVGRRVTPIRQSPRTKQLGILKSTPGSGKRVNIDLLQNKFQGVSEYEESVRLSPSIPYDANKRPCQGVLKPSSIQSPINPYYKPPKGIRNLML